MKRAIPISRNNVIHAGAKSQFGGLKKGFWRVAYQVEILGAVKTLPIIPASWHSRIANMSFAMLPSFRDKKRVF